MTRSVTPTQQAPAAAQTEPTVSSSTRVITWIATNGIFVFTVVLILAAAFLVDGFASSTNIGDVFNRAAPIGIVAVGMTFVVISGNYLDLSVVAQVATSAVILIGISNSYGIIPAILAAFLVAGLYALVNGVAVGYFKANAVIVTLATTYIGLGMLRWLSGGSIFFGPSDGLDRHDRQGQGRTGADLGAGAAGDGGDPGLRVEPDHVRFCHPVVRLEQGGHPAQRSCHPPGGARRLSDHVDLRDSGRFRPRRVLQHRRFHDVRRLRIRCIGRHHHRWDERVRRPGQRPSDRCSA